MDSETHDEGSHFQRLPPTSTGVSFQLEPTDGIPDPTVSGASQPWNQPSFYAASQPKPMDPLVSRAGPMSYLPPVPPPMINPYSSPNLFVPEEYPTPNYNTSPSSFLPPPGPRMGPNPFHYDTSPSLGLGMPSHPYPNSGFSLSPQHSQAYPFGAGMPYFYQDPSVMVNPGTSFDAHGNFGNGPSHLNFQARNHFERGVGLGSLESPSGVTASSFQVNAPSSTISAPSDGLRPSSKNASNVNGIQQQETETASQYGTSQHAASAVVGNTTTTSKGSLASAQNDRSVGGTLSVSSTTEENKIEQQETANGNVDFMSSLSLSAPDKPQQAQ